MRAARPTESPPATLFEALGCVPGEPALSPTSRVGDVVEAALLQPWREAVQTTLKGISLGRFDLHRTGSTTKSPAGLGADASEEQVGDPVSPAGSNSAVLQSLAEVGPEGHAGERLHLDPIPQSTAGDVGVDLHL